MIVRVKTCTGETRYDFEAYKEFDDRILFKTDKNDPDKDGNAFYFDDFMVVAIGGYTEDDGADIFIYGKQEDEMKDGGVAFPVLEQVHSNLDCTDPGMTLRDYFAGQALISLVVGRAIESMQQSAEEAYNFADAMLAEREKTNGKE